MARTLRSRLRLLPLTMLVAFLALGLKVGEVMHDGKELIVSLNNTALAESAETPAAKPATAEGANPSEPVKNAAAAPPATEKAKEGEAKPGEEANPKHDNDEEEGKKNKREYSQIEVDLLQSLAQRRQELDSWSKQVQLKENMLIATEQRINEKINNLQGMKKEIEDLLAQYNEQEDTKIRSLVKIYENMKPKDAARIFEELDMPVLLIVVDRMSERKVSPILANMSPSKAKDLTVQLAEQRKLQKPRANAAAAAAENAATPEGNTPSPDAPASAGNSPAATSSAGAAATSSSPPSPSPTSAPAAPAEKPSPAP